MKPRERPPTWSYRSLHSQQKTVRAKETATTSWRERVPIYRRREAVPTERIARLRERVLATKRRVYVEPAHLITESYKRTEGEPIILRQAKAFRHVVRGMALAIHPDELIVGNRSPLPRMGVITPSAAVGWIDEELDRLPTRPWDCFDVQPEEIRELREEIFPYWRGKTLEDRVAEAIPVEVQEARDCKLFTLHQTDHAQGHIIPNVAKWLHQGPASLRADAIRARNRWPQQPGLTQQQADFYEAAVITLEAASEFMNRYGDLALELARQEGSPERRRELQRIGGNCHQLAVSAPEDFWQALQSLWFLWTLLEVEANASAFSPGRVDQYLNPFLLRDLQEGRLALAEAQELLDCLWIKFNEVVLLRHSDSARYFAGFPIGFNLVVGGQTAEGHDATNLLSFVCLQAQADVGLPQPSLGVRVHQDSPQDFLVAAARVISMGSGMPQVFNDEAVIPALLNRGVSHDDAMNYAIVGCVEPAAPGKTFGWNNASMLNLLRVLELTLHGGQDPTSGRQIGPATRRLGELLTFEDFEGAYEQQLRHAAALMVKGVNAVDAQHSQAFPTPFASTVIDDCLDVGQDMTAGGAHYNFTGVQGVQIANLADSLAALRRMVYEHKEVSPQQLLTALQQNFRGHERLRQRLLCRVPKYGNDDGYVDELARKWARLFCDEVVRHRNPRDGSYQAGFYTLAAHVPQGKNVGATPDGRLAHSPLADGGLSPAAGRDVRGPTAVLRSVGAIDHRLTSNGTLLNLKLLPALFQQDGALQRFAGFLRAFVKLGLMHVQFNVVSAETLRKAQEHPQQYRSLVVRVAGYSAYFVELDKDIQEEIIRRTEHTIL